MATNRSLQEIKMPSLTDTNFAEGLGNLFNTINDNFKKLGSYGLGQGPDGKATVAIPINLAATFYNADTNGELPDGTPSDIIGDFNSFRKVINQNYKNYQVLASSVLRGILTALRAKYNDQISKPVSGISACWFDTYFKAGGMTDEKARELNTIYPVGRLMMNMSPVLVGETAGDYEAVGSLAYIHVDPRFRTKDSTEELDQKHYDISCVLYCTSSAGSQYNFEIVEAFPQMYMGPSGLCWKINGYETGIPVSGPSGKDGSIRDIKIVKRKENVKWNEDGTVTINHPTNTRPGLGVEEGATSAAGSLLGQYIDNGNIKTGNYPLTNAEITAQLGTVIETPQDESWYAGVSNNTDHLYQVCQILPYERLDIAETGETVLECWTDNPELADLDNAPCMILPGDGFIDSHNMSTFWFGTLKKVAGSGGQWKYVVYCSDENKIDKAVTPHAFGNMMMNLDWYNPLTPGNESVPRGILIPIGNTRTPDTGDNEEQRLAAHIIYSTTDDTDKVNDGNIVNQLNAYEVIDNRPTTSKIITKDMQYSAVVNKRILHIGSLKNWEISGTKLTQTLDSEAVPFGTAELHVDEPFKVTKKFTTKEYNGWLADIDGHTRVTGSLKVGSSEGEPDFENVKIDKVTESEPNEEGILVLKSLVGLTEEAEDIPTSGQFEGAVISKSLVSETLKVGNFLIDSNGNIHIEGQYVINPYVNSTWIFHGIKETNGEYVGLFGSSFAVRPANPDTVYVDGANGVLGDDVNMFSLPAGGWVEFGYKDVNGAEKGSVGSIKMAANMLAIDGGLVVGGKHIMMDSNGLQYSGMFKGPLYSESAKSIQFGNVTVNPAFYTDNDIRVGNKVVAKNFVRSESKPDVRRIMLDNGEVMSEQPVTFSGEAFRWTKDAAGYPQLAMDANCSYVPRKQFPVEYYVYGTKNPGKNPEHGMDYKGTKVYNTYITYLSNPFVTELTIEIPYVVIPEGNNAEGGITIPCFNDSSNWKTLRLMGTLYMEKNTGHADGPNYNLNNDFVRNVFAKPIYEYLKNEPGFQWSTPKTNMDVFIPGLKKSQKKDWMQEDGEQQYGMNLRFVNGNIWIMMALCPIFDTDMNGVDRRFQNDAMKLKFLWVNEMQVSSLPVPPRTEVTYHYYVSNENKQPYAKPTKPSEVKTDVDGYGYCSSDASMPSPTRDNKYLWYFVQTDTITTKGNTEEVTTTFSDWYKKEYEVKEMLFGLEKLVCDTNKNLLIAVINSLDCEGIQQMPLKFTVKEIIGGDDKWSASNLTFTEQAKHEFKADTEYYMLLEGVDDWEGTYHFTSSGLTVAMANSEQAAYFVSSDGENVSGVEWALKTISDKEIGEIVNSGKLLTKKPDGWDEESGKYTPKTGGAAGPGLGPIPGL